MSFDRQRLPGAARRAVSQACRDASTGAACEESAVLATSEVVTNALLHGQGKIDVGIETGSSTVRVEVSDEGSRRPTSSDLVRALGVQDTEESGRGLLIVDAVTCSWGVVDRVDGGKSVWFEVPVQP